MEEVNKNGWRKNFIDKIGETEKNLKKLDQSFNVTTKMSDLDNEYRLFRKKEEKNYGLNAKFLEKRNTQKQTNSFYLDSEIVTEINNFIISQNKERLFQTKILYDIQSQLKEIKHSNIEKDIKDLLLKILSQKSLTNENCNNCTTMIKKNENVFEETNKNFFYDNSENGFYQKKPIGSMDKDISTKNYENILFENKISEFDKRLLELEADFKNLSNQLKSVSKSTHGNHTQSLTHGSDILDSRSSSKNSIDREFRSGLNLGGENVPIMKHKFTCIKDIDKLKMTEIPDISLILRNLNSDLKENVEKSFFKTEMPKKILKDKISANDAFKTVTFDIHDSEDPSKTRNEKIRNCYKRGKQKTLTIGESAFEPPKLEHLIEPSQYQL